MHNNLRFKKSFLIIYILLNFIVITLIVIEQCDWLYAILLMTWINMMFYSLKKVTRRAVLLCFGIAFFTFLLGRDGMEYLLGHESDSNFTEDVNRHAYLSMLLSIIGVWLSYSVFQNNHNTKFKLSIKDKKYYHYIRRYSLICFYTVYPIAIGVNLAIAYFVIKFGYAAKFTDLRSIVENTPVFYTFSKIELLLPTAFSIYMASLPSKDKFLKIVKPYIIYLIITLGTGGRGDFILGILLIGIFVAFMQQLEPNIVWIHKRKLKYIYILAPLIAIGGTFMNNLRFGESNDQLSLIDGFSNFFYDQGVTCNAVKNAYKYESSIPKQKDYYTFEFLHTGILARILGNEVYQGNNIEHATKGGSFTHALGYTIMGNGYLAGRGTGTSYIAELYYDFGYLGVFIGSCIYGYIFSLINNFKKTGIFARSIIFIILTKILWAPRGGYSGFLSFIFAPTTIALLLFVFAAAQISYVAHQKTFHK